MNKPTGSYSSWENTMCNSLAPVGEKTRLAWHDGYASAKTEWQGLTDEEVGMLTVFDGLHHVEVPLLASFARAIEAALRSKNT